VRGPSPPALAAVILLSLLAGCLAPGAQQPLQADGAALQVVDEVLADGQQAYQFVLDFPMSFPNRRAAEPNHEAARVYLEEQLQGFGLRTWRHDYTAGQNVIGVRNGTTRADEWVILSAHYDSAATTTFGAWDDGAGSAALLEMARAFGSRAWNRTLAFAFFDDEERGLVGSRHFVEDEVLGKGLKVAANLNFDPPGLNWPCVNPDGSDLPVTILPSRQTTPGQQALLAAILGGAAAAGVPEEAMDVHEGGVAIVGVAGNNLLSGGSDHQSFDAADVPNAFLGGSVPIAVGPVTAISYLLHTPLDTVQQMELRCGGQDLLAKGFQAILDIVHHALVAFDAWDGVSPPPEVPAHAHFEDGSPPGHYARFDVLPVPSVPRLG
jgi:peptidase M28-like protein